MEDLPPTMRALVAPRKCLPEEYEIREIPLPKITLPTHVLIRVHAATMNTGDLQALAGQLSIFHKPDYPSQIGAEGSGVVVAIGPEVKDLKVGEEVYGLYVDKPMFRFPPPGLASDYALFEERFLLRKPPHLKFEEASALAARAITSYQTLRRGLQLIGEESLEGKTVYVPAGLSSTGSIAIQMAKNVFGASRIITTVSTPKVPLVEQYLPGLVDQVIDYKTQKIQDHVPKGSVDFMFNTQDPTLGDAVPLINPNTGVIMSIKSIPPMAIAREIIGADRFSWWIGALLTLAQLYYKWKLRGTNIKYEMLSGGPQIREDLEKAGELVALGKVRAIPHVVDLNDIEAVRAGCQQVVTGQGGTGQLVIKIA